MSTNIRTGIIGYGLSGRVFHAPFIDVVEGYDLTKISTSRPESIANIEERYPVTAVVPDGKSIIDDPEIDLVIVTSPNTDHFRWSREALLAGKHVVVEKPFTVSVEEADELIEIARRQQKILTVYHNRRFTSDTRTVKNCSTAACWVRLWTTSLISTATAPTPVRAAPGVSSHSRDQASSTTWDLI